MWKYSAGTVADLAHRERWARAGKGHTHGSGNGNGNGAVNGTNGNGNGGASPSSSGRSSPVSDPGNGGSERQKQHNVKKELKLDANERWNDALKQMKEEAGYNDSMAGKNDVRSRWARATLYAHHLGETTGPAPGGFDSDNESEDEEGEESYDSGSGENGEEREEREEHAWTKHLEELHYLEMIDPKHRYGSNLKYYHRRWIEDDTEDNFFKWLDRGAGKDLSLPECPRQHLESATVRYLTPEQRFHYLVEIDKDGRLRWSHNHEYVDTTPGTWEDVGEGRGVVSVDADADAAQESDSQPLSGVESEAASVGPGTPASEPNGQSGTNGTGEDGEDEASHKRLREHFTGSLTEHLLRKTLRRKLRKKKETWIYVSSLHYDLYVGIKSSGSFQHSSFLAGGLITSAGTIRVREGVIQSMNPLSGHYRTSIEHFRSFTAAMNKRGADLSKVSISKAVASLWGAQQAKRAKTLKSQLAHMPRSGIRSLQQAMCMTPIHASPSASPPQEDYDEERMAKRREMLYGRPPSDKAKKSLESVVEVPEPPEEGGWV